MDFGSELIQQVRIIHDTAHSSCRMNGDQVLCVHTKSLATFPRWRTMQRMIVTFLHKQYCIVGLLEGSVLAEAPLSTAVSEKRRAAEQQSSHVGRRDKRLNLPYAHAIQLSNHALNCSSPV